MPIPPVSYNSTYTDLASDLKCLGTSEDLGICIRTLGVLNARSKRFPGFRFEKLYGVRLAIAGS